MIVAHIKKLSGTLQTTICKFDVIKIFSHFFLAIENKKYAEMKHLHTIFRWAICSQWEISVSSITPSHALSIYVFWIVEYFKLPYYIHIYICRFCYDLTEIRPNHHRFAIYLKNMRYSKHDGIDRGLAYLKLPFELPFYRYN